MRLFATPNPSTMTQTKPKTFVLNAAAPAYVPLAVRTNKNCISYGQAMPWHAETEGEEQLTDVHRPTLLDLPSEVLTTVLSGLGGPSAVVAGVSCKQLLREVSTAPLTLALGRRAASMPAAEAREHIEAVATSLAKYTPGIFSLDIAGTPVENEDIMALLHRLTRLQSLCLAGCRRLTGGLATGLLAEPPVNLATLDLQRCFQMNTSALCDLLSAVHAGKLPALRCLAMSHLDLSELPQKLYPLQQSAGASGSCLQLKNGSGLCLLALHNCSGLSALGLRSLAEVAPSLKVLMLGGCTFAADIGSGVADGSGSMQEDGHSSLEDVTIAVEACPELTPCAALPPRAAIRAVTTAAALAFGALRMRCLAALEITFAGPGVAAGVSDVLGKLFPTQDCSRKVPELWDLTHKVGLQAASAELERASNVHCAAPLRAAVKAAANCSNTARSTPLHLASYTVGGEAAVTQLLSLGSSVETRDAGGASPLFLASEAGRGAAVRALLAAGADACVSNAAGESPLYIAALKGHLGVVRHLVGNLVSRNVVWTQLAYPDGWTPLMAAVVAGHTHVVRWLISSAGMQDGGTHCLLTACNRYGQSALHIAARKASPQLLRVLLGAGGGDVLRSADALGETPMDVAKKYAHMHAVEEFRRVQCARA
mmetsp:Transcript_43776/g.131214  ORF Transcript_43776/g.131214 Transcript_43776/m.131214 type:complete len:653 (-) Transcript_43776:115-2073(-)